MNDKVGVGIIGTGWVSGQHIDSFQKHPHTEVVGILSRVEARAVEKAREHSLDNCQAYTDLGEMLDNDAIQIVSVCTPSHLHAEQGIQCADAGRHILVEKPMALDLSSMQGLRSAVEKSKVKSLVSFVLRWNPLFETIKVILGERGIGSLLYAEVDYLHGIGDWYAGYEWIRKKQYGGNNLFTGGCHAVDALRWFVGSEIVEIFSYANTGPRNLLRYEYEPNSMTVLKFADGTIGKVACSIECVMPYTFNIELQGDEGTIRNNQFFTSRWPGQTGWATIPTILPDSADVTHHPFDAEIDHFVACILRDVESHCNIADAYKTHEVCLAMEISAHEGHAVGLPL